MDWLQDLRFAVRMIRKKPWFSAAIVATLACGMGVNTTIFSLVNAVMFKPLPFQGGNRLVMINATNIANGRDNVGISYADFRDFRQVMLNEGVAPLGQIIYNSGVVFCQPRRPDVGAVFERTLALAQKYRDKIWSDQTYLSLAMELSGFNPYTLSSSFNYRAFGELISGSIRIWHSYEPLPANAASLEKGYLHRYEKGKLVKAVKVPL